MSFTLTRLISHLPISSLNRPTRRHHASIASSSSCRQSHSQAHATQAGEEEEVLVVVGGGAAGVFGAIRAKTVAPNLKVLVIEKGKPLSKVKVSGGGRCNVTNGHCPDNLIFSENYPRGHREFKGSFFKKHGYMDTMAWFRERGVGLKTEDDGRVFPISDSSSSIIDCLMSEAKESGVLLQTGKVVTAASVDACENFLIKVERRTADFVEKIKANYLLIASGSSKQGYSLATQLGHSLIDPVPSLFTFKIADPQLSELAGVTFPKVRVKLKMENIQRNIPELTQVGPMLVTHWGLSSPVILRLSAWGARYLFNAGYEGIIVVDFLPDVNLEGIKSILSRQKLNFTKQKLLNSCPLEFGLVKRFWKYIVEREGVDGDILWASVSNNSLSEVASLLKQCTFQVTGKGQFKDEFVTAGGVPLSEISLNTMESKIQPSLFFAGEVLNVDGVTGGFNFQVGDSNS